MASLRVLVANVGHAADAQTVAARMRTILPNHGRWVVLGCEGHRLEGRLGIVGGAVQQAPFDRGNAAVPWRNPDRGKAEVFTITGPAVEVEASEVVKLMDGPEPPTKFQSDRWARFTWARVEGQPFVFVSWHGQANIQRAGVVNPLNPMARDYKAGVLELAERVEREAEKGYLPVVGGDANYRRTPQRWAGSPFSVFKDIGLAVRAHRIDQLATDAATITWDSDLQVLDGSQGTDHKWLTGDIRSRVKEPTVPPTNSPVRQRGVDPSGRPIWATDYLWGRWEALVFDLGFRPTIVQGSWMTRNGGGADASAGYHDFGGALDLRTWDRTPTQVDRMISVGRLHGWDAWRRSPDLPGGMDAHAHMGLHTDTPTHPGIQDQHRDYLAGGNGLSGSSHAPDHEKRPSPLVTTPPKGTTMPTLEEIRGVIREEIDDALAGQPAAVWAHKIGSIKPEERDVKAERMLSEIHRRTGDTRDQTKPEETL